MDSDPEQARRWYERTPRPMSPAPQVRRDRPDTACRKGHKSRLCRHWSGNQVHSCLLNGPSQLPGRRSSIAICVCLSHDNLLIQPLECDHQNRFQSFHRSHSPDLEYSHAASSVSSASLAGHVLVSVSGHDGGARHCRFESGARQCGQPGAACATRGLGDARGRAGRHRWSGLTGEQDRAAVVPAAPGSLVPCGPASRCQAGPRRSAGPRTPAARLPRLTDRCVRPPRGRSLSVSKPGALDGAAQARDVALLCAACGYPHFHTPAVHRPTGADQRFYPKCPQVCAQGVILAGQALQARMSRGREPVISRQHSARTGKQMTSMRTAC
jgi:hypothetical protein